MKILDSSINIDKFDLNVPVFTSSQRRFFEGKSGRSSNASRDKQVAKKRLEESIRTIYYLLRHSHNLHYNELKKIFTSQTIKPILENLLKDYSQFEVLKDIKHDFRTTEMARLMFEISSGYLKGSTNSKTIHSDIERVSDHFKAQSESELRNETYRKTKKDESTKISRVKPD